MRSRRIRDILILSRRLLMSLLNYLLTCHSQGPPFKGFMVRIR